MSGVSTVVVHSVPCWLEQTETWLHNQVVFLPETVESHVVCETTKNLDQFPVRYLHSLEKIPSYRSLPDRIARKLGFRKHLRFLVSKLEETGADVLHSHFGNVGWRNLEAARNAGVRHVVTFYGFDLSYLPRRESGWNERYAQMFPRIDRVLCEGPHMAHEVEELGCPHEKITVHHLGVDVDRIPFRPKPWKSGEPLFVLIAGSFKEKKGIPYAIRALGMIRRDVDLRVTLIGDAGREERSRQEKKKILRTIEETGLREEVRLLGYVRYEKFFREAYDHHLFLSPSVTSSDGDTEGGAPVTLIDMAASGRLIVSTRHCDIPEVILDGKTGFLAEERNVDELAAHLLRIARHQEEWEGILAAGRRRMETEFNARIQGDRLAGIYGSLRRYETSGPTDPVSDSTLVRNKDTP